jgi:RNA polymerase sigma-70 factor (ECF subfamily)
MIPPEEPTLEALLRLYQQGDSEAARRLIERAAPVLFRSVRPFVADAVAAEEILQEAWLRIHSSRHTWRPDAPALPWLLAITRYTRLDHLRRAYRRREAPLDSLTQDPPAPESPAANEEFHVLLQALPDSQREVVLLLKGEGLSLEEVARATGNTIGAVKQKASRAYAKLRSILTQKGAPA